MLIKIILYVPKDDIEFESFTVTFVGSLLVYEIKDYLQVYLDNRACNCLDNFRKQKTANYLHERFFEDYII